MQKSVMSTCGSEHKRSLNESFQKNINRGYPWQPLRRAALTLKWEDVVTCAALAGRRLMIQWVRRVGLISETTNIEERTFGLR